MTSFLTAAPETISALLLSGPGSAPMAQASTAYASLAEALEETAGVFSSVISGVTGEAWAGPAATAMVNAAAPYTAYLSQAASHAAGASRAAEMVGSAFDSARAAIVPPLAILANRRAFGQLVRLNWFGLLTPTIMAAEAQYEAMWATDVEAMLSYHAGAVAAAEQLPSALAQFVQNLPNLGVGNKGNGNIGSGNTGSGNIGMGNSGDGNSSLVSAQLGYNNVGGGNQGNSNLGAGNVGNGNVGLGNNGNGNIGSVMAARRI